ncbi:MAG TPA: hypothetical protein VF796_03905 [Humisphaera sp.]
MRNALLATAALSAAVIIGGVSAGGCATKTEGERTMERADRVQEAGATIRRGELAVQDGKALEARGRAVRDQGDSIEGDRLIAEGRAQQAKGEQLIREGRAMKP